MNSPCVNCGADSRVCKKCDWYNGVWISKDQYEAKLKADMVAIFDKIRAEIEAYQSDAFYPDDVMMNRRMVLEIIDKYRGEVDCRECKAEYECYYCKKYAESEEK